MTITIKKKDPPPQIQCVSCGVVQIRIGQRPPKDWGQSEQGLVCGKDACRESVGLPRYIAPQDR